MNSLIILAAGCGNRANQKIPKQFINLEDTNTSRLLYNQYAYQNKYFDEIIIVTHKDWYMKIKSEVRKNIKTVIGGETRTQSSYLGLKSCSPKCKNVIIHDAARPFASKNLFESCVKNLDTFDSVVPIIDQQNSVIEKRNETVKYLDRNKLKIIQTPQAFNYTTIRKAYDNIRINKTDDLQVLLEYQPNAKIKYIKGTLKNFKITTEYDIRIVQKLYSDKDLWKMFCE